VVTLYLFLQTTAFQRFSFIGEGKLYKSLLKIWKEHFEPYWELKLEKIFTFVRTSRQKFDSTCWTELSSFLLFFTGMSLLELSKRDLSLYKTDMPIHFLVWYATKKLNIICISAFTANIPSDIPVLLLEVTSKIVSNDLRRKPIHTLRCYLIPQRSATARPVSRSSVASKNLIRSQINLFWICCVLIGHRKSFLCVRPVSPSSLTPHI